MTALVGDRAGPPVLALDGRAGLLVREAERALPPDAAVTPDTQAQAAGEPAERADIVMDFSPYTRFDSPDLHLCDN